MQVRTKLSPEEQRKFQAAAWGLEPDATWQEIREHVHLHGHGTVFVDPDDWNDTMTDLYGSEIFD